MRRNYTVLIWGWTCDQVWSHQHSSQTVQLYGEECLTLTQQDISMILDRTTYTLSTVSVTPTWEVMSSPDCNVISLSHYMLQILTAHRYHWDVRDLTQHTLWWCSRTELCASLPLLHTPTHTVTLYTSVHLSLSVQPAQHCSTYVAHLAHTWDIRQITITLPSQGY